MILNLTAAPKDPIERLMWLTGVKEQARKELDAALAEAYFEARLRHQLPAALAAGPYAKKRVLAMTRGENERRGRVVRWGDQQDPTSSAYYRT